MKNQTTVQGAAVQKARATLKFPGPKALMRMAADAQADQNITVKPQLQEQEIASLACKIWQEQGCPEGHEEMHWKLARQELLGMASCTVAT